MIIYALTPIIEDSESHIKSTSETQNQLLTVPDNILMEE